MTAEELQSASQLLDLLRKKGARSFKGFGIELELAPAESKPEPIGDKADANAGRCACGHMDFEHQSGLCIAGGCSPELCAKKAT